VVARPDNQDVPAGEGAAEQGDAVRVDPLERTPIGDRGLVVLLLLADVKQLARLAGAGTEVAVVEDESGDALLREALGVRVEAHLTRTGEAVRHDDERQRAVCVGLVDPRSTPQIAGLELHFMTRERHALAPLGQDMRIYYT
jgi:hypothetical protein